MKKLVFFSLIVVTLCSFKFYDEPNPLLGKWEWKKVYKEGPIAIMLLFRNNGTYDGFANQKSFVTGTYRLKKDTLYISDPICNSKYEGTYKMTMYGAQDSVRFDVIADTCKGRVEGANATVYKRIKAIK